MSGYPDPNYAPPETYPSTVGESCENPKPYWFYKGGTFCEDVTILGSLTTTTLTVQTDSVTVGGDLYEKILFRNPYDSKFYYVLAHKLPKDFVPPPIPIE
jgi:hypothetical protein